MISLLRQYVRPYAGYLAAVVGLQLVQVAASLYLPSLNANIIDNGVAKGDTAYIWMIGAVMLGVSLVQVAAQIGATWFGARSSMSFGRDLRVLEPERGQQQLTRILETLATASAIGDAPLGNLLMEEQRRFGRHTTLVVVTSATDDHWLTAIQSLTQRGVRAAVVLMDPSTFGSERSPLLMYGQLTASDIMTYVVRKGDDLGLALSPTATGAGAWQA